MLEHILELYSRCGESLIDNGLKESVLPCNEIFCALDLFVENGFLISGGDLYKKNDKSGFEPIYADWFYDGMDVRESVEIAREYLYQFRDKPIYVSFIFKS